MTQQVIGIGNVANDRKGDPLRTAFAKTNANFAEIYTTLSGIPTTVFNGGTITTGLSITENTDWADLVTAGGATIGRSLDVGNALYIGAGAKNTSFYNPTIIARQSGGTYIQAAIVNSNGNGSADWVAYGDNGNDAHGWVDMGFTGSTFNDPAYTITEQGEGYLFVAGYPDGISHGSLVLCTHDTGIDNDIVFGTGGFTTPEKMRLHNAMQQFHILMATESTSVTTGALRIDGGVGVAGNLNVGGNVAFANAVGVPLHNYGATGDRAGMFAVDANYFYYCTANYVNTSTTIWKRTAHGATTW